MMGANDLAWKRTYWEISCGQPSFISLIQVPPTPLIGNVRWGEITVEGPDWLESPEQSMFCVIPLDVGEGSSACMASGHRKLPKLLCSYVSSLLFCSISGQATHNWKVIRNDIFGTFDISASTEEMNAAKGIINRDILISSDDWDRHQCPNRIVLIPFGSTYFLTLYILIW